MKPRAFLAFINNHVFCTDVLFIRTKNVVGAQSAQWWNGNTANTTPGNSNAGVPACADSGPSARIADCARMKSHPCAIGDLV
jgi:hypothetical protein